MRVIFFVFAIFDYLFYLIEIAPPVTTEYQGAVITQVKMACVYHSTILFSTLADFNLFDSRCSWLSTPRLIEYGVTY